MHIKYVMIAKIETHSACVQYTVPPYLPCILQTGQNLKRENLNK